MNKYLSFQNSVLYCSLFLFLCYSALGEQKTKLKTNKSTQHPVIYSKHWFGPFPLPKDNKNPLLIHDIFIISFNSEKKFPFWVAYHLSPALIWGKLKEKRQYVVDPLLPSSQALTFKNYKGASNCDGKGLGYDKGHLAPLGSFKASSFAYQAQYLSNIVPQKRNLNRGPWKKLEQQVRQFVKKGNEVRILTGTIFGQEGKKIPPCWAATQNVLEEIPSAYWKIIAFKHKSKIKICSFIMPQKVSYKTDHPKKYKVPLKQIEHKTGLSILKNIQGVVQDCQFML